ncbi:MAG: DUF2344 domain-containing protein [Candidatus Latescibacterota bacterium]|nr:MAG: DUF2344 domain-containing protein [Candidatus Latescibacterota bacterium]
MVRIRIRYEKRGPIRFTSHRDLMRIFRRCFAAGEVPVRFSQGFNPHPRLSFGPSLRTGWESPDEYMDVLLEAPTNDIAVRCNRHLPDGLRILEVAILPPSVPKLGADVEAVRYEVVLAKADVAMTKTEVEKRPMKQASEETRGGEDDRGETVASELETAIHRRFAVGGPGGVSNGGAEVAIPVVLEAAVRSVLASEGTPVSEAEIRIDYLSTMHGGRSVTPEELLTPFLGDPTRFATPMRVVRAGLYVRRNGRYLSPISREVVETLS